MQFDINLWAVLVAGISTMVVGSIWYGPLFGKSWAKERGFDSMPAEKRAKMMKSMNATYAQAFVGGLIMSYVMAHVLQAFDSDSVGMALQGTFFTWLGFILPVKYSDMLWSGGSFKLVAIESVYYLVSLGVISTILQVWK